MNTNIKKCPFCASEPIVDAVVVNEPSVETIYRYACPNCYSVRGFGTTDEYAIASWNRRCECLAEEIYKEECK